MAKTMKFTCPDCGEDIFIEEIDSTIEDMTAYIEMTCYGCSAEWTEVFRLDYVGYSIGGEVWDMNGEKIV